MGNNYNNFINWYAFFNSSLELLLQQLVFLYKIIISFNMKQMMVDKYFSLLNNKQ